MLMTLDSFWTLLSSKSPFLMVSWYCQFLLSGLQSDRTRMRGTVFWGVKLFTEASVFEELYLLVSTISLTLSILQWRRPAAMNRDSSLRDTGITQLTRCAKQRLKTARHLNDTLTHSVLRQPLNLLFF